MKLWAKNSVVAVSRYWYFMGKLRKIKKASGEIIHVQEVTERSCSRIRNFAIWIRYNSRSGIHNMYKEYRGTSLVHAVNQMYAEMASRHMADFSRIHIVKTAEISNEQVKRDHTLQFIDDDVKFPLKRHNIKKDAQDKTLFSLSRPVTYGW
eukprot:CAMPEP_0117421680 /NCGR_PEP_ID=MMETSP0758-20121206/2700_1 /TAXON_ID=63605 /ORGANISM="Percolomonas cosmopolitus, Strain AE-1 (ATCC 50343)" /LENGTH=150 /DNA_ID=CAMNT_0005203903 /DNA_START=159 /DNA_END=611 /DNA_ORIENTATION=+